MSVTSARSRAGDQAANPADSAALLRAGYATVATMTVLALVRGALGAIWFTETLWKLPWKNYGCPADFTLARSGLCDWIGREIANPPFGLYHSFLVNVIGPNIRFVGLGVLIFLAIPAGRFLGTDQFLLPRLMPAANRGNALARLLVRFM